MNRISVIIPVYNSVRFINSCLESIINQTYKNLEIIIVDDGSTDGSDRVCNEWLKKDKRIIVIHQQNQGVSVARNHGLEYATGEYISFVDSDDTLESDMYEILMDAMFCYRAEITHCGYKRVNEQGDILKIVNGSHIILEQDSKEAIDCMLSGQYFVGSLWNKLYSKSTLKNIRFCEELKNNEDILFNFLVFQNAKKIVFIDEPKYNYYEHDSSACNQLNKEKQIRDSEHATTLMTQQCKEKSIYKIVVKCFFYTKLDLYRYLIMYSKSNLYEKKDLKEWLKKNHYILKQSELKLKINYYLLVYCPQFYRIFYHMYDKIRQPNWDTK